MDNRQAEAVATHRRAGNIMSRFETAEGERLRNWLAEFKDRQANAGPGDPALRDDFGQPEVVDVKACLDSLAFWVASQRLPRPWQRPESDVLSAVATKSRDLAALLSNPDGPQWRNAYDLFDENARVTWDAGEFATYRRRVVDVLRRQTLRALLANLADEAERLGRLTSMDSTVRYTPRFGAEGAYDRLLAREIRDWFRIKCPGRDVGHDLIADVINMSTERTANNVVTAAQVTQWLRPSRRK